MFERLSESARAVLVEAEDLAIELASPKIEVSHVLYGCAQVRDETAGKPLRDCGITGEAVRRRLPRGSQRSNGLFDVDSLGAIGIDVDEVRRSVEATFGVGALGAAPDRRNSSKNLRRPSFDSESKEALETSLRVALELHDKRIKPGHILLALLRMNDNLVSDIIEASTTNVAGLSSAVLGELASA